MLKKIFFESLLIQILFYPFIEAGKQCINIFKGKHTTRSFLRVLAVIIGAVSGILCFFYFKLVHDFFFNLSSALLVPEVLKIPLAAYLSLTTFSGAAGYFTKNTIKIACKAIFGDQDYFLTKAREDNIEKAIKEQGYTISKKTIKRMVEHCINKLRNPPSKELCLTNRDWKMALEAILYNSDIEVFLEQQSFILFGLKKTEERIELLKRYSGALDLDSNILPTSTSQAEYRDYIESISVARPSSSTSSSAQSPKRRTHFINVLGDLLLHSRKWRLPRHQDSPRQNEPSSSTAAATTENEIVIQRHATIPRENMENQERITALGILNKFKHYKKQESEPHLNQLLCTCYDILGMKESTLKSCSLPDTEYLVHFMLFMTRNITSTPATSPIASPVASPYRTSSSYTSGSPLQRRSAFVSPLANPIPINTVGAMVSQNEQSNPSPRSFAVDCSTFFPESEFNETTYSRSSSVCPN